MVDARSAPPTEQEPASSGIAPDHEESPSLRDTLAVVLPPFALSRALLLSLTGFVALVREQSPLTVWNQWDSKWYLGIAAHGYHWSLHGKPALAFFPLYPLLVRLGVALGAPSGLAALLVSNLAFVGALFYLHRLTVAEWDRTAAKRAIWLLALFPTAFFTFAPYTESLFLLCASAALYHGRGAQPWRAGLWAAAALATRSTGIVLLPAILVLVRPHGVRSWLLAISPSIGTVLFYTWYLDGERIQIAQVLRAQRAWHRALTFPWTGFTASFDWLARHAAQNAPWAAENLLQLAVTVFFLALTVAAWRHLGRGIAVYCAGFWLVVLLSPQWLDEYYAPFSSMDRFVLALFPLAGWAAARVPRAYLHRTLLLSGALMVASCTIHLAGGWVG